MSLARLARMCSRHGIPLTEAIDAFGLAHTYDAAAVAEWIGLS